MKEATILMMLEFHSQLKLQHWNTFGYSTHIAIGDLYDEFGDLMDEFVETAMGKYGRADFPDTFQIELRKPETINDTTYLTECVDFLISLTDQLDPRTDSDLLNQRDEMLGVLNKVKYLLTLTK